MKWTTRKLSRASRKRKLAALSCGFIVVTSIIVSVAIQNAASTSDNRIPAILGREQSESDRPNSYTLAGFGDKPSSTSKRLAIDLSSLRALNRADEWYFGIALSAERTKICHIAVFDISPDKFEAAASCAPLDAFASHGVAVALESNDHEPSLSMAIPDGYANAVAAERETGAFGPGSENNLVRFPISPGRTREDGTSLLEALKFRLEPDLGVVNRQPLVSR